MHKASYLMIAAAIIITASILMAPVFSASSSPCGSCHGSYSQYLDILESNAANQLPALLTVGQSAIVSVVVENRVNAASYTALSGASLSLSSQSGHFSVNVPVVSIGILQKGTAVATWQVTGVSAGSDTLVITASATNTHNNLAFSDTYSPAPGIVVSVAVATPTPTTPTSAPTSTPSSTAIPISTSTSTASTPTPPPDSTSTLTAIQAQTSTTTSNPTVTTSTSQTSTTASNVQINSINNPAAQNQPLLIWFTGPLEEEKLAAGDQTIAWTTNGGSGNATTKLELSKTGSSGPWITLANNLGTSGNFVWNVPNQDADYVIRATATDSANPQQTASVTVAAKVNQVTHLEAFVVFASSALLFFSVVLTAVILDKRPAKIRA
jgi:hypothetical protein